ncbi:SprT family protein [Paenibacillus sp. GCM10027627]|uniref:SprT family protein n=1 Tax=unclassified Paenibacillus TaxID=185978 RepID=UPI00363B1956
MDNGELQIWVERVSMEAFGLPFRHRATFNGRLKSTGGRYFTGSHHIEISPYQLEAYGAEETERIIKHELCHYHLHLMKRGYKHRDADFKSLLARVGGSRYCKALPGKETRRTSPYRYKLVCIDCKTEYLRKRRVDPARFACGKCRGKLKGIVLDIPGQP